MNWTIRRSPSEMRRAAKRDTAEAAIVDALRKTGWSVEFLNCANGPDLMAGKCGRCVLIEVKTGKKKLRPGQEDWHRRWLGPPVVVVRTVEDALKL